MRQIQNRDNQACKIQYCNYEHSDRDYKMKHGAQYKQKTQPGIKHGLRFLFI